MPGVVLSSTRQDMFLGGPLVLGSAVPGVDEQAGRGAPPHLHAGCQMTRLLQWTWKWRGASYTATILFVGFVSFHVDFGEDISYHKDLVSGVSDHAKTGNTGRLAALM